MRRRRDVRDLRAGQRNEKKFHAVVLNVLVHANAKTMICGTWGTPVARAERMTRDIKINLSGSGVGNRGVGETGRVGLENSEVGLGEGGGCWKVHLNVVTDMQVPHFEQEGMVEKERNDMSICKWQ